MTAPHQPGEPRYTAAEWRQYTNAPTNLPPAPRKKRRWPWVVAAIIAVFVVIGVANSGGTSSSTSSTSSAQPGYTQLPEASRSPLSAPTVSYVAPAVVPAGPATEAGDGIYEVGVDIAAGRYKTAGPDQSDMVPNCYYARRKDDSGGFGSIIANDNTSGPSSVTVKAGEFVEFSGDCVWTLQ